MNQKTLYIIDLFSFIFRAYYAIRPLSAPDGTPVNAVYGVVSMIKKLIELKKPDHVVVCMESKEKKNFREAIYPEYKANRAEPPEDLSPQIGLIEEFVRTYPFKTLSVPGFEADDIIATLVKKYSHAGVQIYVVTSDKDLMQLVNDHVFLYDTMKDKVLGHKEVIEKFGVPPDKVLDVQSLCGDPTDNVPGINGVGPKTAAKLVLEYGDMDGVLANADKIKGKVGEKIASGKEDARLSRKLVALDHNVPLEDAHWKDLELQNPDSEKLIAFYKRLGFRSLIADHGKTTPTPQKSPDNAPVHHEASPAVPHQDLTENKMNPGEFITVTSINQLQDLLSEWRKNKPERLAFDTETDSLDDITANLVGISLCADTQRAFYLPVSHKTGNNLALDEVREFLNPLFMDPHVAKTAQNAKFDMNVLTTHGFAIKGLTDDTLIASYLIDPEGAHDLDTLAAKYLGHDMLSYKDVVKKGETFADVDMATATRYAAEDAWAVFALTPRLEKRLKSTEVESVYRTIEVPLVPILSEMERHGVLVNQDLLKNLGTEFSDRLNDLEKKIHHLAGGEFNINSTKQLGEILFQKLHLPVIKRNKTGPSTDVDVLTALALHHDLPKLLLEYRMLAKLKSTYVEQLANLLHPKTGRIHTRFNQAVVATGRLSSTEPNLQNIPIKTPEGRRIREIFIAPPGHVLLSADYSQIELRLLAAFSQDPRLMDAYRSNEDIHRRTAAQIFGIGLAEVSDSQRAIGKTINFGVIYGQSSFGLAQQLGVPQQEARLFISKFYEEFAEVRHYRDRVLAMARHNGYVTTHLGRRRYLPELNSRNKMAQANAERAAFNAIFQGSAADLIKKAMIDIDHFLQKEKLKSKMILQVHDELLFEVPHDELKEMEKRIPELMSKAFTLDIPLDVGAKHGRNWGEAH